MVATGMLRRMVIYSDCCFTRNPQRTISLELGELLLGRGRVLKLWISRRLRSSTNLVFVVTKKLMNGPVLGHTCSLGSMEEDFNPYIEKHWNSEANIPGSVGLGWKTSNWPQILKKEPCKAKPECGKTMTMPSQILLQ